MVSRPNAPQTDVAEILPGPARNSPDYYSLSLANVVWGGAVGARLGMNIREDKGYSYGVFSFPAPHEKYGMCEPRVVCKPIRPRNRSSNSKKN